MLASENGEQWSANIQAGFASDSKLASRIVDAGNANRVLQELFFDIGTYVLALQGKTPSHDLPSNSKKRKLEHNTTNGSGRDAPAVLLECKDVSFQAPMRKKLRFECSCDVSDQRSGRIQLVNSTSGQLEYGIAAKDIAYAFCLPQPEKQARQQNIILMPASSAVDEVSEGVAETVVFTLNETPPAGALVQGGIKEDDTYVTVTQRVLHTLLAPFGKSVVRPDEGHFASSIVQPHRRGEKAYHVKAHLAAKEGYLFFLASGIFFGFKKPVAFFPFSSIESISYTSVLQRTFNLVVTAAESDDASQTKDIEFSMIDQSDFAGIDEYVKRHGLNDASMAAQRRAKAFNVNREKKLDHNGTGVGEAEEDGQTELQKAEQILQDAEDEEEEDYEASGGESDGEGEETEEEDEYEDGGGDDVGDNEDEGRE